MKLVLFVIMHQLELKCNTLYVDSVFKLHSFRRYVIGSETFVGACRRCSSICETWSWFWDVVLPHQQKLDLSLSICLFYSLSFKTSSHLPHLWKLSTNVWFQLACSESPQTSENRKTIVLASFISSWSAVEYPKTIATLPVWTTGQSLFKERDLCLQKPG